MSESVVLNRTLSEVVETAADRYGSSLAIEDGECKLSFSELNIARVDCARAFHAAGVNKGDRIAIWAPNMYQWVVAAIGAQTIGAVLVPLNTRYKGSEASYILNSSGASMLFIVAEFLGVRYSELLQGQDIPSLKRIVLLEGDDGEYQTWDQFLASGHVVSAQTVNAIAASILPTDTLDILYTSGTTGKPKGVVTNHGQNILTYEGWSSRVGLRSDDNYLIINPFFHSFGCKAGWLSALITGATMYPVKTFDLDATLIKIERDKISMIPGPPAIYQSMISHPDRDKYDLSSLRLAVTGAAPVPVELVQKMRDILGFEVVVTAYGLTEASGTVSACRPDDDAETISTTSGAAIPGVEIKCVDTVTEQEVPFGEPGEIWFRGYNVMQGYFNSPEETARTITEDGWMKTGDIGVMNERGYIRITDRIKEMFIVGGFNCYPAEIESTLCSMPGVAQAAIIGVPDERMGEVARGYVIANHDAELTQASVISWCRDHMANYKAPRTVEIVEKLPLNASGKVDKQVLRDRQKS
jgi:acyl-CoA synthetase (AMP-forming)/AMP-acid ligase II